MLTALTGRSGVVYAVKLYPSGATTNSEDGVTDLFGKCLLVLEKMIEHNMPLLVISLSEPNCKTTIFLLVVIACISCSIISLLWMRVVIN